MPYHGHEMDRCTGMTLVLVYTPLFVLARMNWSNHHPVVYEVIVDANETARSNLK